MVPPSNRIAKVLCLGLLGVIAGCGPAHGPPKVVLSPPQDLFAEWQGRTLYNTPHAFIYAHSAETAGEADRWVAEVKTYIKRNHHRDLEKGIVIAMEPSDPPMAHNIQGVLKLENDSTVMITKPRNQRISDDVRNKMEQEGIPEGPTARATPLPLSPQRVRSMGLAVGDAKWASTGSSHELAAQSGIEVVAAALKKKNPNITAEKAREAASRMTDLAAKPFEMTRGNPIFILWVQRQSDWSDEQRREAIRKYLKHTFRKNWLPAPSDEELGW